MLNDTFLNNLWYDICGLKEDWSWLDEPNPPNDDWKVLMELLDLKILGLRDLDIKRLKDRLIMGSMRYGRLRDRGRVYYDERTNQAINCAGTNLECYYDLINFILIRLHFGHVSETNAMRLIMFYTCLIRNINPPYNPKDRV